MDGYFLREFFIPLEESKNAIVGVLALLIIETESNKYTTTKSLKQAHRCYFPEPLSRMIGKYWRKYYRILLGLLFELLICKVRATTNFDAAKINTFAQLL